MNEHLNRRKFLTGTVIGTIGMTLINPLESLSRPAAKGKRVGIIGLDTSHSIAFTKMLNADSPDAKYLGYKVVAAYPYGSRTIESSARLVPLSVPTIEMAGGSVRCMLAGIHLSKR